MDDLVQCPYCRELIRDGAVKCKHCGSTVIPEAASPRNPTTQPRQTGGVPSWAAGAAVPPGAEIREYRVTRTLGAGGMGEVYEAEHTYTSQRVALKAVHPGLMADQSVRRRFLEEGRVMGGLKHPNIVSLLTFFEEAGRFFLVMEYIEGRTLEAQLRSGPMAPLEAARIMVAVLGALHYAHSNQTPIVHRDIKPANIMLDNAGRIVVMDFGIAKALGREKLTRTGGAIGTYEYMSPEQVQGMDTGPASDQYSAGIVLYQMLAGKVPFVQETDGGFDVMKSHVERLPPPIPGIDPTLDNILRTALQKDPARRFPSCQHMADALNALMGNSPTDSAAPVYRTTPVPPQTFPVTAPPGFPPAPPTNSWQTAAPAQGSVPGRSSTVKIVSITVAAVLVVVVAGLFMVGMSRKAGSREESRSPEGVVASVPVEVPAQVPPPSQQGSGSTAPSEAVPVAAPAEAAPSQPSPPEEKRAEPAVQPKTVEVPKPEPKPEPPPAPKYREYELAARDLWADSSSSDKTTRIKNGPDITYGPSNVLDGDPTTAWAEGVKGSGYGEWLEIHLPSRMEVVSVGIMNGYQKVKNDKYGDRYYINERPSRLKITTDNGDRTVWVQDEKPTQKFELGGLSTRTVRLTILDTYSAKYPDTAISEVRIWVREQIQ